MVKESSHPSWRHSLLRGGLIPSLVVAALAIAAAFFIKGLPGLYGAALASVTVLIFFSVHLLVAWLSKDLDPMSTMALAMLSYFLKVGLMAGFLIAVTKLTQPETIERGSFAITALALTAAWLGGEIRAFLRLRWSLDEQ
jgi:ATP synthase protein I